MNKNVFIGVILLNFSFTLMKAQSWNLQLNVPGVEFNEVNFADANTGWVFGDSTFNGIFITGLVMKTTNNGTNWIQQNFGSPDYRIFASSIVNSNELFVAGRDGSGGGNTGLFVKSSDGGNSWTNAVTFPEKMFGVCFINSLTGWVMGKNGYVSMTTNGGTSWSANLNLTNEDVYDMKFFDANTGIMCCGGGEIYRTVDGGSSWNSIISGSGEDLTSISIVGTNAWICGSSGEVIYSTNNGLSWLHQITNTTADLLDISFYDQTNGFVCGIIGQMRISATAGTSWINTSSNSAFDITSLKMINSSSGWYVNPNGDIYTYNTPSGVNFNAESNVVTFYPNPSKNLIHLLGIDFMPGNSKIYISDMNGKLFIEQQIDFIKNNSIDISCLTSGIYVVRIVNNSFDTFQKLVKI